MTQEERQKRSRELIRRAAVEEFGVSDFETVSMDRICSAHQISKGMMYHYFSNKEELFLYCVEKILQSLTEYIEEKAGELDGLPPFEAIKTFYLLRETFFLDRGKERHIFENAMFYPPESLTASIRELRKPIREVNHRFVSRFVSRLPLRDGLEKEQAVRYLDSLHSVFWNVLKQYRGNENPADLHSMLEAAEDVLDMLLFGIAKKPEA